MPITDRGEAKESGWRQIRAALRVFEGDVIGADFGMWPEGNLTRADGTPVPPREYLEIVCTKLKILEALEELSFIPDEFTFRVTCSDYKGTFWVEDFLASADTYKLLIPEELVGKRITWKWVSRKYVIQGRNVETGNFVIAGVKELIPPEVAPEPIHQGTEDLMAIALEIAVGKTEAQFRSALSLHPLFSNSRVLQMAKVGAVTAALVDEGSLVVVNEGGKSVYRKP